MTNRNIVQKVLVIVVSIFLFSTSLRAQGDQVDNGGKITAVVICVAVILIGIVAFLFYLERRIRKIEEVNEVT